MKNLLFFSYLFFILLLSSKPSILNAQCFDSGVLELSSLDGNNGFVLNGLNSGYESGTSVSNVGDVNGDGFDDLIIGAPGADGPSGDFYVGESYLVFGNSSIGNGGSVDLDNLNGTNGFTIYGVDDFDAIGGLFSSNAGDINADGIDDLIIGVSGANENGISNSGASYVVFGSLNLGSGGNFFLSNLNGINGFVLNGIDVNDFSGESVSNAGDVNADGIDDIIIGAPLADPNGLTSGESYVVFGNPNIGSGGSFELSNLNGSNGFVLNGVDTLDRSGASVSNAGDVNADGVDDLIIGAYWANSNGSGTGESYVVFGNSSIGSGGSLELSGLNGSNGFVINGVDSSDSSGESVSNAGDINGDGIDDLIIGAPRAEPNGITFAGASYVVFGNPSIGSGGILEISDLNGSNGFILNGIDPLDYSGESVSNAGDVNSDGIDDIIIGTDNADPNGTSSGESYLVYGNSSIGSGGSFELSSLNGSNGFILNGISSDDKAGYSVSNAGDINGDGIDDIIIGAPFADSNGDTFSGESYVVFGCSDCTINIGDQIICASEAMAYDLTTLEPMGRIGGIWTDVNDVMLATPTNVNLTDGDIFTYTYTNVVSNCVDSDTITFTVFPIPSVSFNAPADVCGTTPVLLSSGMPTGSTPTGGVETYSGTGVVDNMNGTYSFDPNIAGVGGPYTITYEYCLIPNCCVTVIDDIIVNVDSNINLPPQTLEFCSGETVDLTSLETLPGTYEYNTYDDFLYVPNSNSNDVSVIDLSTNQMIATIPVGQTPQGVATSPDGNYVYVSNLGSHDISVISTSSNTVAFTISAGLNPAGIMLSPDGNYIYVTTSPSQEISVIDANTNQVVTTISVGMSPTEIAISPDGNYVYVTNRSSDNVSVIDVSTYQVTATIPVGDSPQGIAISPDGNYVYVSNASSDDVSVIDVSSNMVISTIPAGNSPYGIATNPNGDYVYVTNTFSDDVSVIDMSTNMVIATIVVGDGPHGVTTSPDGNFVYVVNRNLDNVSVIDANTNMLINTLPVGNYPAFFGNFYIESIGSQINNATAYIPTDGEKIAVTFTDINGCMAQSSITFSLSSSLCSASCTTTQSCDDGDPMTINDMETLASDGSVCVPCAGTLDNSCTLEIPMVAGWNLISSYCIPNDPAMEMVFVNIASNTIQVKDLTNTYVPAFGFNGIGNWDITSGYQVKMLVADTLVIEGTWVDPLATPITLNQGWNLISYLLDTQSGPFSIYQDINPNVIQIKDLTGTFIPSFNFNDMGDALPTRGYQVKMLVNDTLIYDPANIGNP